MQARFLAAHAAELDLRLLAFSGGTLRNVIPREAFATLAVDNHIADALKSAAAYFLTAIQNEHGIKEPNIALVTEPLAHQGKALTADSSDRFLNLLNSTPNSVIRNSDVVETSLNIGVVTMEADKAEINCLIRSLIDTGRDYVVKC